MDAIRLLYRDDAERERLRDMSNRLARVQLCALAILLVAAVVAVPVYGWLQLIPLAAAGAFFAVTRQPAIRSRGGAWSFFAAWVFAQLMVLVSVGLMEGPVVYVLCAPIFPMLLAATAFRRATVVAGAVGTVVGLIGVTLLTAPDEIAAMPPALWLPALLLFVITVAAMAVRDADLVTRDEVVVDELTGLLNRVALQSRVTELTHQVQRTHERVAIVVADLDHFKQVNDEHGHGVGDEVLVAAATRLSEAAGTVPVFRYGGEEFVAVLTGADEQAASELAERMREAVARSALDGVDMTASFGVALSSPDDGFEYGALFVAADTALYLAKEEGRDRVCLAGASTRAAAQARPNDTTEGGQASRVNADPADGWDVRIVDRREGNWLVRDAIERAHLVDLTVRTESFSLLTSALVTIAILSVVPWVGWELLVPVVISGIIGEAVVRLTPRLRRPEFAFLGGFILLQVGAAVAVLVTGPSIFFGLSIFAITMFGCGASLPARGSAILVVTGAVALVGSSLSVGSAEILANPMIVVFPVALMISLAIAGWGMGHFVSELRVAAISDGLTGTLNRAALEARLPEVAHRVAATGEQVSVLVVDLDRFKAVNDDHGHKAGDRVLAEVAYRMRAELRTFDSIYRIGGEEFVVLLPGTDATMAATVAERVRVAVAREPVVGIPMTVSVGVAESRVDERFSYDEVFARGDAALLTAKREGRDRVVVADVIAGSLPAISDRLVQAS
ncbi:MAG: GGDEF domain-containing protein [Solirubrobacteraceae bacterium]|nr:GGDEF domain-containing protein [Solirubrobacteraceae bacterium]